MSEKLFDRELQHRLLLKLREGYPRTLLQIAGDEAEPAAMMRNMAYLNEHALCNAIVKENGRGQMEFRGAALTAKGIDFLEDDGGLSAILGVVTVKLHADTIRDLIAA